MRGQGVTNGYMPVAAVWAAAIFVPSLDREGVEP